jgi:hypothetical protein
MIVLPMIGAVRRSLCEKLPPMNLQVVFPIGACCTLYASGLYSEQDVVGMASSQRGSSAWDAVPVPTAAGLEPNDPELAFLLRDAQVGGVTCSALLDTGAADCFLNTEFALANQLNMTDKPTFYELANGEIVSTEKMCPYNASFTWLFARYYYQMHAAGQRNW